MTKYNSLKILLTDPHLKGGGQVRYVAKLAAELTRLGHDDFGYGGIFTLDLGTREAANRIMDILQNRDRFGFLAVSLGYFETLMSASASSTSSEIPEDEQKKAGIRPGLVRISIGVEHPDDLILDITQALRAV